MCHQPPGTDVCNTFKSSLMRGRFKNHEICYVIMISYVEVVVKNWKGFAKVTRVLLTNRSISKEVLESREQFVKIWSQSDDRIDI